MTYTFVLVHGAWHGGWCWARVADRLRSGGHTVFTPTLTGVGERVHLLRAGIDLKTHIREHQIAAGQWQDGQFVGVSPSDFPGVKPVIFPKPAW